MMRDFALRFIEALLALDLPALTSTLADDVLWHLPPFAKRPPLQGRDAVLTFVQQAQAAYYEPGTLSLEPEMVVADSDSAAVLGTLRGRTIRGKPYENCYSFVFRIADGRVVEAWELLDTAHLLAQMR
ncbi:MAG TPA: nuclear transport factor 2 family protein [Candidatus Binatia bacterium]